MSHYNCVYRTWKNGSVVSEDVLCEGCAEATLHDDIEGAVELAGVAKDIPCEYCGELGTEE